MLLNKRVQLVYTNDEYVDLPAGTRGTVNFVDDTGTVFVKWDNGVSLGLIPGVDYWTVIDE